MSLPLLHGRAAWVFTENDFDVDQIVGVKNIKITDIDELAAVAMQSYDPDFPKSVKAGDLLVGGVNFGYGHPHYPPMRAMRHLGIRALLAESFSPGFWRGEISMGFPLLAVPGILQEVQRWDELSVDWDSATVLNHRTGRRLAFEPLSRADSQMLAFGGLTGYLKSRAAAAA
ncbi:MAG: 3-isopropylmalate dehydratase [Variovorax sp.]|nr:3-isopropylmalate dehydratase [Variovorax sp.]